MFQDSLYDQIERSWKEQHSKRDGGTGPYRPLPLDDLRTIVDVSFRASLRQEEGRPVRFSIALMSADEAEKDRAERRLRGHDRDPYVLHRLAEPIAFMDDAIVKIAPAFDPDVSAILVEPARGQRHRHEIWGAMLHGTPSRPPFGFPVNGGYQLQRPDVFICVARSPGSLLLRWGELSIGRVVLGQYIPRSRSAFGDGGLGSYLQKLLEGWVPPDDIKAFFGDVYHNVLRRILTQSAARAHGSSIIIIPEDKIDVARQMSRARFSVDADFGFPTLLTFQAQRPNGAKQIPSRGKLTRKVAEKVHLAERLDALAQLTAVDGALLLRRNLEPIAFGVTLQAPKWTGAVIAGAHATKVGAPFDASRLGTRHNSAIDFVGACKGAVAFVISSDGPVRGLVKRDSATVLCWPECE